MSRITLLFVAVALTGCGGAFDAKPDNTGGVEVSARTYAQPVDLDVQAPSICATFELQAYSLAADGTETDVGDPVSIATPADGSPADLTFTCTDGPVDASGNNWGYLVTASNFTNCASGQPIAGLSPATVTANYPVDCRAGQVQIEGVSVEVSISANDNGGYLDVAVGVALTSGTAPPGGLCGDYSLQPLGVNPSGNTTEAGSPVDVSSNFTGVDDILGCVAGPGSPNWALVVTPGGFYDCASHAPVQATVAPMTMNLDCVAGIDILAAAILQVSIP